MRRCARSHTRAPTLGYLDIFFFSLLCQRFALTMEQVITPLYFFVDVPFLFSIIIIDHNVKCKVPAAFALS